MMLSGCDATLMLLCGLLCSVVIFETNGESADLSSSASSSDWAQSVIMPEDGKESTLTLSEVLIGYIENIRLWAIQLIICQERSCPSNRRTTATIDVAFFHHILLNEDLLPHVLQLADPTRSHLSVRRFIAYFLFSLTPCAGGRPAGTVAVEGPFEASERKLNPLKERLWLEGFRTDFSNDIFPDGVRSDIAPPTSQTRVLRSSDVRSSVSFNYPSRISMFCQSPLKWLTGPSDYPLWRYIALYPSCQAAKVLNDLYPTFPTMESSTATVESANDLQPFPPSLLPEDYPLPWSTQPTDENYTATPSPVSVVSTSKRPLLTSFSRTAQLKAMIITMEYQNLFVDQISQHLRISPCDPVPPHGGTSEVHGGLARKAISAEALAELKRYLTTSDGEFTMFLGEIIDLDVLSREMSRNNIPVRQEAHSSPAWSPPPPIRVEREPLLLVSDEDPIVSNLSARLVSQVLMHRGGSLHGSPQPSLRLIHEPQDCDIYDAFINSALSLDSASTLYGRLSAKEIKELEAGFCTFHGLLMMELRVAHSMFEGLIKIPLRERPWLKLSSPIRRDVQWRRDRDNDDDAERSGWPVDFSTCVNAQQVESIEVIVHILNCLECRRFSCLNLASDLFQIAQGLERLLQGAMLKDECRTKWVTQFADSARSLRAERFAHISDRLETRQGMDWQVKQMREEIGLLRETSISESENNNDEQEESLKERFKQLKAERSELSCDLDQDMADYLNLLKSYYESSRQLLCDAADEEHQFRACWRFELLRSSLSFQLETLSTAYAVTAEEMSSATTSLMKSVNGEPS
eukprot:GHVH01002819.1.p1 GENE.GHVH01002819.1~~GHVH01002819.1.p1  ORF type:complete len:804 (+),score=140.31 GHVH01002819.1:4144-6555(+)